MATACGSCGSQKQVEFAAEMNICIPGLEGLGMPMVWVFPKLLVCLGCGLTIFTIPEAELQVLEKGIAS